MLGVLDGRTARERVGLIVDVVKGLGVADEHDGGCHGGLIGCWRPVYNLCKIR